MARAIKIAFAICLKNPEQLLGAITLMDANSEKASLGYWIGHDHWGKGYCTQALEAMLRFAFEHLELPSVNAEHLQSNPASGRVMKNCGMRFVETVIREDRYGERVKVDQYRKLRES